MSDEEAEKEASAAPEVAAELEVEGGEAPAVPAPDGAQESAAAEESVTEPEPPAPEISHPPSALESDLPPASEIIPRETEPPDEVVPEPPSPSKEEPAHEAVSAPMHSTHAAHSPAPRHSAREHMQKVVGERLQVRLTQILTLVAQRNVVSNNDVQVLLAVSDATATRYLSRLVKSGLLRRTGEGTGTRYELAIGSNSAV